MPDHSKTPDKSEMPDNHEMRNHSEKEETMAGYYHSEDLACFPDIGEGAPELWKTFSAWYGETFKAGALSEREKALIALAVAHAVQCPYCIDAYTQESLAKGADLEQLTEAVHVSAAITGGATLVHGMQMRRSAKSVLVE
jgi:alkylhydroperoxidase/carboxymuconolactone decarboxylase family protein